MGFLTALSSPTPGSLSPAFEHCLGDNAGFTISERLATPALRNEAY